MIRAVSERAQTNKSMRKKEIRAEVKVPSLCRGRTGELFQREKYLSDWRANNQGTAQALCGRYFRRLTYATVEKVRKQRSWIRANGGITPWPRDVSKIFVGGDGRVGM